MKRFIFSSTLLFALFVTKAQAQFTNKLEFVCGKDTTIEGNGIITFNPSDFAICSYTTQIFVNNQWINVKVNEKTPQNGQYSFKYTIPEAGRNVLPLQVRTVTNRQTSSTFTIQNECVVLTDGTWAVQDPESKTVLWKLKFKPNSQVELENTFEGNVTGRNLKWSGRPNNFLVEGTIRGGNIQITGNVYNNNCTLSFKGLTEQLLIGQ